MPATPARIAISLRDDLSALRVNAVLAFDICAEIADANTDKLLTSDRSYLTFLKHFFDILRSCISGPPQGHFPDILDVLSTFVS